MTFRRALALPFAALLLAAGSGGATTIVMAHDEELIAKSPVIVVATVSRSEAVDRNGGIWTETLLETEDVLRGPAPRQIVVREVGGRIGDRFNVVFGSPEYRAGETVLAFLAPTPRGDYQTVDLFVGKFTERRAQDGRRLWFRNDEHTGTRVLDRDFNKVAATKMHRDASAFEEYVEAVLSGDRSEVSYWVKQPVAGSISPDFTLIDEPNIYRWFAFDNGGTVPWRHSGTQAGYSNGGVTELQAAMAVWTGYSAAKIRYTYAGASSAAPGGLDIPNGLNEVMFNDPRNEIQGTWNGSSGVVGRGGFNSIHGAKSWTSPFAADASHPQKTYGGVLDIAEGNLVIQDGVAPNRGISSAELAEILAHEFGHTLGLGHSTDNTALMFASITGLGAGLRPDDQNAAKWLYPSGSGGGPSVTIPSAPSNLAVTGLGTSLILTWKDNADNETVQTVYLAATPGNFLPVLSVNANLASAALQNLQPGKIYYVRVTASNSAGESSASNQVQGSVPGDTLKAAFNASPTSGIANLTAFVFVDKSTGPVSSRQWTFGDGNSSSAANVTHVYTQSGNFTVTLRVFDAQGQSSTAQIPVTVKAGPDAIGAAFSFAPRNPVSGADVQFTDTSVGPVSQWLWTFGDGGTSTERHPKRRYANAGVYEVKLTVSNGSESSTAQETLTLAAGSGATPLVDADFDLSTLWPAAGRSVSFYDRSSGSPNSWLWSFGDGTESTLRNPTHAYETLGTYTVTLRAGNGPSSSLKEMVIHVNGNSERFQSVLPVASLTSGAGSSFWRTELTISNQTASTANVDLLLLPASGGSQLRNSVILGAGESLTWDNALTDLFALAEGSGAVSIESNGGSTAPLLRVSSRTFTTSTNGTYGQYVPALPSTEPATLFIPGLEWNGNYRTNVGLVNHGSQQVSITLSLYDERGRLMGNVPMTLAAQSFQQTSLMGIFPVLNGQARNGLALRVQGTTAGAVSAYASVIDNRSQDPILIPAKGVTAREDLTVPVVARVPGARGTFWRSDVIIFNPTGTVMTLGLKLTTGTQPERSLTIASGETATIEDVVTWLGEGNAQGPLRITVSGNSYSPLVSSRTYTTRESDGGTYGQWIEAFGNDQFRSVTFVTGLRSDSSFRTNVGLVNSSDAPVGATVALFNTVGMVTSVPVVVPARGSLQLPVGALFPQVDTSALGVFSVKVESAEPLSSYGSVIDNGSGDPVFIRGD